MKITKEQILSNEVRLITLNEPFASLMSFHGKNETRSRDTKVRGLVCIHAAKVPFDNDKLRKICSEKIFSIIKSLVKDRWHNRSKILSIGYLVGTKFMGDYPDFKDEIEAKCFVKYNPDLWIWEFEDMTPIEPIFFKGSQGWSILTSQKKQLLNPL